MSRFRDAFDATRGNDEDTLKHFDEVVKPRADATVQRGRKNFGREEKTDKCPKPVSELEKVRR
jgi:hypothetical protein